MTKKSRAFTIAVCYTLSAAAVSAACLMFKEFAILIIIAYLIAVGISIPLLVKGIKKSEKKKALKKLRDLSEIIKGLNAMVILWDADFHFIEVNDKLTSITGYTADDLRHNVKNLEKLLPPDAFAPSLQAIVNSKEEEFHVTTKRGAKVCTIWNTSMISIVKSDTRTTYVMMSIGLDLSETAKMKEDLLLYSESLALSESRFTMSMELSEIGLLLKEAGQYQYYLSEQLRKMMGSGTSEYMTADDIKKYIHPKDIIAFESMIAHMTKPKDSDQGMIHDIEFKMLSADGTYHWYQFRFKVTPASSLRDASVGGAVIDITKDKEKDTLIEKMAYIDDVTQIYNRNKFMLIGQETYDCSVATENADIDYWIIVLDIDDFHIINDTCGYKSGNKLLESFAKIIMNALTDGGFGARIGGDNFALIVKDTGNDQLPTDIIKTIQSDLVKLSDEYFHQGISCSAGYCKMT
ncbi:MAG: diguanylate cyclase, partial [Oscillospiraceae bacterium]|nr:diguanylate cyclase [Oscillospiraceae bacterium]